MAGRTFETIFKLAAVFTGAAAFSQASNAVKGIEKTTKAANAGFKAMAGAMLAVGAGFVSIQKIGQFMKESREEALAGQKAFDKLGTSLQRVAGMQKLELIKPGTIAHQQQALYDLASTMEQAGGIAKTTLAEGFASLSRSFKPEEINKMSTGIQDFIVRTRGIKASSSDVSDMMGKINLAIQGQAKGLATAKILTVEQDKVFKGLLKTGTQAQRAAFFYKILGNQTGETARQMGTFEGKMLQQEQAYKRLQENAGRPMLALQEAIAPAMTKIFMAVEPFTEKISDKLVKWFKDMGPAIDKMNLDALSAGFMSFFGWLEENWDIVEIALVGMGAALIGITAAVVAFVAVAVAPWAGIAAGVAAVSLAIGVLVVEWNKMGPEAQGAIDAIMKIWEPIGKWFFDHIVKPIQRAWNDLVAGFRGEISWGEAFQGVGEEVLTIFQNIGKGIIKAIGEGLLAAGKVDWGKVLGDASSFMWTEGPKVVGQITKSIGDAWNAIDWMAIFSKAVEIGKAIDKSIGDAWNAIDWTGMVNTSIEVIVNTFKTLAPKVGETLTAVKDAIIKPFQDAYNFVANLFKGLDIGKLIPKINLDPRSWFKGGVPGSQMGGIISHPTISTLAEKGPEMVIPLTSSGGNRGPGLMAQAANMLGMKPSGQSGQTTVSFSPVINVSGAGGDAPALGREVERALERPMRTLLDELKKAKAEEQRLAYA